MALPEGNAIVYCDKAFATTYGKTAHGLVRRSHRYRVLSVVDSSTAGRDAGELLDGTAKGIPIVATLTEAVERARASDPPATHLVIGLAPDGGRISPEVRAEIFAAVEMGLNVDAGLHDFLTDDTALVELAARKGVELRDIRKPPPREALHFFDGKIEQVEALTVAILGTDSAVGKRTTAWVLLEALRAAGLSAELVGTGQTAWLQGARHGIVLDSLPNDFVTGEIEHAVWSAWSESRPDIILIEGQGSLLNPAYPGGFEILAAGRPDAVILQHAPARQTYDGFPNYPLHPLDHQIRVLEMVADKRVVAVTVNHEDLSEEQARAACTQIAREVGRPAVDVLLDGAAALVDVLRPLLTQHQEIE